MIRLNEFWILINHEFFNKHFINSIKKFSSSIEFFNDVDEKLNNFDDFPKKFNMSETDVTEIIEYMIEKEKKIYNVEWKRIFYQWLRRLIQQYSFVYYLIYLNRYRKYQIQEFHMWIVFERTFD